MTTPHFDVAELSVAMTSQLANELIAHVDRSDGQEDLCFLLWRPSTGNRRVTALVNELVLPEHGERHVHGNVSFEDEYFFRAAGIAAEAKCGLALVHSHPRGRGWQGLSTDDHLAESGHAAQAVALTGLPLLGLTVATGDRRISARFWFRTTPRTYEPRWCATVRVVGDRYLASYNPALRARPAYSSQLERTTSAWGADAQADLARIRVGVIGAGSVGDLVGEGLARTGLQNIFGMDFDTVEYKNLDRLVHASRRDARLRRGKAFTFARGLRQAATAERATIEVSEHSIVEPAGFQEALDCDVLFSCVDRPWPRAALNLIAYAHLIPVIDGGVLVEATERGIREATWTAHIAAPGRACLECLGQYDPAMVALERSGHLDDPRYIRFADQDGLPPSGENVFAFAASAASAELTQFLTMAVAPGGIADHGAQRFSFKLGTTELVQDACQDGCLYSNGLLGHGDHSGVDVTGVHVAAADARRLRNHPGLRVRLLRAYDTVLERLRADATRPCAPRTTEVVP